LFKLRILLYEVEVAFTGRQGKVLADAVLHGHIGILQEAAEKTIKFGNINKELFKLWLIKLKTLPNLRGRQYSMHWAGR